MVFAVKQERKSKDGIITRLVPFEERRIKNNEKNWRGKNRGTYL